MPQTENTFQEFELMFRSLVEMSPIGVGFARDGITVDANRVYLEIFGYDNLNQIRNVPLLKMIAPECHAEMLDRLRRRSQGLPVEDAYEVLGLRKNGSTFPLHISAKRIETSEGPITLAFFVDLTDQKQKEQTVKESTTKYKLLFETSNDGIFLQNSDGFFIDCNEKGAIMLGRSKQEVIGLSPADISPERQPDGRLSMDIAGERFAAALNGKPQQFEFQTLKPNGNAFDVELSISLVEYAGAPCIQAIARDITERKQGAENLRESEERFRVLVQHAPEAIIVFDVENNRIVDANINAEKLFQCDLKELLQLSPTNFIQSPETDNATYSQSFRNNNDRILQGEQLVFERTLRGARGQKSICEVRLTRLPAGNKKLIRASLVDITERKTAEEKLRESKAKLRGLFELSPLGISLTDMAGHYIQFNQSFEKITGYSETELLDLDYWMLTPGKYATDEAEQLKSLKSLGHYGPYEKEYRRKDGSLIPIRLNGMLISGRDGQQYIWSIVEDITGLKEIEKQKIELHNHFNMMLEEEKSHIAREIHDELGSKMTAMKRILQQVIQDIHPIGIPDQLSDKLKSVSNLIKDTSTITRNIISELRPAVLDDLGLLAAIEWQAEEFHKLTGIEYVVNCIGDNGQLERNYSIALFRILQEALENVTKHSGASMVEIEYYNGEDEILLSISDNGHGLPADWSKKANSFGIRGIKERVNQLNGKIEFNITPSGGHSMLVKLPLSKH
jgi:PAS domain S-box-containing protein